MATAAHPCKVYFKATSASVVAGDEVANITDFSVQSSKTVLDITDFKDTSAAKIKLAGLEDGSFSVSGQFNSGDAPQLLVRSTFDSGAVGYLTILTDPAASAGSQGYKYPVIVSNYSAKGSVDGTVDFDASFVLSGAKTAV